MYVYKYSVGIYSLCMIAVRVWWCTCRLKNVITLGKLIRSVVVLSPPSSSFLLTCIQKYKNELARPVMGTIFLVIFIIVTEHAHRTNQSHSYNTFSCTYFW